MWSNSQFQYNGFVFRLMDADFPAQFGHWGADLDKPLKNADELQRQYRDTIIWRIGEAVSKGWMPCDTTHCACDLLDRDAIHTTLGQRIVQQNPSLYNDCLLRNPGFLTYVFEDYEIVLSRSIAPKRIINVLPHAQRSGRTRYREYKYQDQRRFADDAHGNG